MTDRPPLRALRALRGEPALRAFTLVELLVVIGIIALLISILLPALNDARRTANDVKCAINVKQLVTALVMYAGQNKGAYPPNINQLNPAQPVPPYLNNSNFWYDKERIGTYMPKSIVEATGSIGGPVFVCPNSENVARSYAMNIWASSMTTQNELNASPQRLTYGPGATWSPVAFRGTLFKTTAKDSTRLILIGERWPNPSTGGQPRYANATIGFQGATAGERFLGIPGGVGFQGFPLEPRAETELDYSMHRRKVGKGREAKGKTQIGFADSHVELLSHDELGDPTTGKSRLRAKWSPYDGEIQ